MRTDKSFYEITDDPKAPSEKQIKHWCVVQELVFEEKKAARLSLAYKGKLLFEDMEFSKSALTTFTDHICASVINFFHGF